jgi:hypothetical protein
MKKFDELDDDQLERAKDRLARRGRALNLCSSFVAIGGWSAGSAGILFFAPLLGLAGGWLLTGCLVAGGFSCAVACKLAIRCAGRWEKREKEIETLQTLRSSSRKKQEVTQPLPPNGEASKSFAASLKAETRDKVTIFKPLRLKRSPQNI